jgi:hypothetical protein
MANGFFLEGSAPALLKKFGHDKIAHFTLKL